MLQGKVNLPYLAAYSCLCKTFNISYTVEKCPTDKEPQYNNHISHSGQSLTALCGFTQVWLQHKLVFLQQILIQEGKWVPSVSEDH